MQNPPARHPALTVSCRHTRLAESSVAAIDACSCGVLQLHLGAFTLRLAPCAALELLATLDAALTRHAEAARASDVGFAECARTPRGQA
jgi:hypothetical protein